MRKANDFFNKFQNNMVGSLNTCLMGQIVRFDPERMAADVSLLPDGDLIIDVPVAIQQTKDFYIRVPHQVGDTVLVVFCQRDIDGIMHGDSATPSQRMLSLDDAIVIGGINLYKDGMLPSANAGDLVIGKKNGGSKIVLNQNNNNIEVTCNQFTINGRVI
jgi:Phage protein Gp138 N-terminal domain